MSDQWAERCFKWVGRNAPTHPHSQRPKAMALIPALQKQGLAHTTGEAPNAFVSVNSKSEAKAALIFNIKAFNHVCACKARRFRLHTRELLAGLLRVVVGGWAAKVDLGKWYWSIHPPSPPH